jgi:hypothetical protein
LLLMILWILESVWKYKDRDRITDECDKVLGMWEYWYDKSIPKSLGWEKYEKVC